MRPVTGFGIGRSHRPTAGPCAALLLASLVASVPAPAAPGPVAPVAPALEGEDPKPPPPPDPPPKPREVDREALLLIVRARFDAGDLEGAAEAASRLIRLQPRDPRPYFYRAFARSAAGDVNGALKDYDTILELDPYSVAAHTNRGELRMRAGQLPGAKADFDAVLELEPGDQRARLGLAAWHDAKGNPDLAEAEYARVVAAAPKDPEPLVLRGWARLERGFHRMAIDDFTRAMELDPKDGRYPGWRAEAKRRMRDYEGAVADFGRAIALDPETPTYFHDRGISLLAIQDFKGALADFDRSLAARPGYVVSLHMRGKTRLLQDKPDLDGADEDLRQVIAAQPYGPQAYWTQSMIRRARGDMKGALASVERAVSLCPGSGRALANRAELLYELRRWDEALADYRAACAADPDERDWAMLRIWILRARSGDEAGATEEMTDYLRGRPGVGEDDAWFRKLAGLLAGVVEEKALFDDWKDDIPRRALEKQCEAYFFAGMRRIVRGDRAVGEEYLRKCRAADRRDFLEFDSAATELEALAGRK